MLIYKKKHTFARASRAPLRAEYKDVLSRDKFHLNQSDIDLALKADEVFVFGSNLEGMHGGGIAGFREKEIAPLFAGAIGLENVCLPEGFVKILK